MCRVPPAVSCLQTNLTCMHGIRISEFCKMLLKRIAHPFFIYPAPGVTVLLLHFHGIEDETTNGRVWRGKRMPTEIEDRSIHRQRAAKPARSFLTLQDNCGIA